MPAAATPCGIQAAPAAAMTIGMAIETSSEWPRSSTRRTCSMGASDISTPMEDAVGPRMSTASTFLTLASAVDADTALGHGGEPGGSDRLAACVALAIAAVSELGERPLQLLL